MKSRPSHALPPRRRRKQTPREREITTKRRGELSELAFTYKAASLGFAVSRPFGDSERYDFILDSAGRLLRVQVKSSTTLLNGLYHVNGHRRTGGGRAVPYEPSEVDFLVAHIVPEDTWFILPIGVILRATSLLFAPRGFPRPALYDAYREAWHLLR